MNVSDRASRASETRPVRTVGGSLCRRRTTLEEPVRRKAPAATADGAIQRNGREDQAVYPQCNDVRSPQQIVLLHSPPGD